MENKKINWVLLPLIILFTFCLRLLYQWHFGWHDYLSWANQYYYGPMTKGFLEMAKRWLQPKPYTSIAYPPGYIIFLACFKYFHIHNLQMMRLTQNIMASLAIIPLYFILHWQNFRNKIMLVSLIFYAMCPLFIVSSANLLSEWISIIIIILTLYFLVLSSRVEGTKQIFSLLICGLIIGVGALFRPDLILLIFLGFLWLILNYKQYRFLLLKFFALGILFFAVIFSWGVHNYKVHHHWIFTSTSGGNTLYEGLGEIQNPYGYVTSDKVMSELAKKMGTDFHSTKANQYFKSQYIEAWKQHPGYVVKVILYRWVKILFPYTSINHYPHLRWVLYPIFAMALVLFLLAIIIYRKQKTILFILLLPMCYAMLSIGLVHYELRYVVYAFLSYLFAFAFILEKYAQKRAGPTL